MTPDQFREDLRRGKDTLEQILGEPVVGYRAPTFSIVRRTWWAIDVLGDLGFLYDSSIYPVRHDRYGVPRAPRSPFLARASRRTILELPPASLRVLGASLPTGGGGYFRLLPLGLMRETLRQVARRCTPPVATLYFHPWEFDPTQPRLDLPWPSRARTYHGIGSARRRLGSLLNGWRFDTAAGVAGSLDPDRLEVFSSPVTLA
jgi:polysaccharide deacetylase family protein (PEP-CTERM system associated)